jgi:hypothetical protein
MFKAYYIRKTFQQAIAKSTGNDAIYLTEFRKNYNDRHATEDIHHARQQITASNIYMECGRAFYLTVQILVI